MTIIVWSWRVVLYILMLVGTWKANLKSSSCCSFLARVVYDYDKFHYCVQKLLEPIIIHVLDDEEKAHHYFEVRKGGSKLCSWWDPLGPSLSLVTLLCIRFCQHVQFIISPCSCIKFFLQKNSFHICRLEKAREFFFLLWISRVLEFRWMVAVVAIGIFCYG